MFDFETHSNSGRSDEYLRLVRHDAFAYGALNRSAALIYWCLLQQPMTPTQLVQRSGRSRATVYRALERMSNIVDARTGAMLALVEKRDGVWSALDAPDLDLVALVLGTAGKGRRKKAQYESEREKYRRQLNEGVQRRIGPRVREAHPGPVSVPTGDIGSSGNESGPY